METRIIIINDKGFSRPILKELPINTYYCFLIWNLFWFFFFHITAAGSALILRVIITVITESVLRECIKYLTALNVFKVLSTYRITNLFANCVIKIFGWSVGWSVALAFAEVVGEIFRPGISTRRSTYCRFFFTQFLQVGSKIFLCIHDPHYPK